MAHLLDQAAASESLLGNKKQQVGRLYKPELQKTQTLPVFLRL